MRMRNIYLVLCLIVAVGLVSCGGSGGNSTPSPGGSSADTTAPTVPTSLTGTATSSSSISLAWTASTDDVGVSGYKIFRNGTQVSTSTTNSFNDPGLSSSATYTYTVSAYDAAGNNSAQSLSASATTLVAGTSPDTEAPTVPANLSATASSTSQINLTWTGSTDNMGVTGYKIYRGGVYLSTATSTTSADTGLSASTSYCYTVSAIDAANNESAKSSSKCATTSATLTSIAIMPSNVSIVYGLTQQLFATGIYADGTSAPLTSGITWASENTCSLINLQAFIPIQDDSVLLSDLSPLSLTEKLAEARKQFTDISTSAKSGDTVAIGTMQSISTIFLTLSRQYNASGAAYFTDLSTVKNTLIEITSSGLQAAATARANACGLASLRAFTNSLALSNLGGLSPEGKLIEARAQFTDISARAKLCDAEAIYQINDLSTSLLNASSAYYGGTGNASYLADFTTVQNALSAVGSLVCPNAPASITNTGGLATGVAVGTSIITATSGGISGNTILTITVP